MANVELLEKVLHQIRTEPETWEQSDWVTRTGPGPECKTAYCFAGWTAIFNGAKPPTDVSQWWLIGEDGEQIVSPHVLNPSDLIYVRHVAIRALDISPGDAAMLFAGGNPLPTLVGMVEDLIALGYINDTRWVRYYTDEGDPYYEEGQ